MFLKVAKMFLENMLSIQNWRSVRFIQEIDTFIQQECIKLIKSESEGIYNITKYMRYSISNICCSFELSIKTLLLNTMKHLTNHKV